MNNRKPKKKNVKPNVRLTKPISWQVAKALGLTQVLRRKRQRHWSYDTSNIAGLGKVKKKPASKKRLLPDRRKRVQPKLANGRVLLGEPRKRKPEPKKRRSTKLIDFAKGDYVLFNATRDGNPVCIDGTVTKVRRCFDRRREEFIIRLRIEETPPSPFVWTVRYPGTPIVKGKR